MCACRPVRQQRGEVALRRQQLDDGASLLIAPVDAELGAGHVTREPRPEPPLEDQLQRVRVAELGALVQQRLDVVGLERRGLARRSSAPNDRRSYALYLTDEGQKVLARASRLEAQMQTRLDAKLGPGGREQLIELLGRLATRT